MDAFTNYLLTASILILIPIVWIITKEEIKESKKMRFKK